MKYKGVNLIPFLMTKKEAKKNARYGHLSRPVWNKGFLYAMNGAIAIRIEAKKKPDHLPLSDISDFPTVRKYTYIARQLAWYDELDHSTADPGLNIEDFAAIYAVSNLPGYQIEAKYVELFKKLLECHIWPGAISRQVVSVPTLAFRFRVNKTLHAHGVVSVAST